MRGELKQVELRSDQAIGRAATRAIAFDVRTMQQIDKFVAAQRPPPHAP